MPDVLPGISIGHWDDPVGLTGCTVLLPIAGTMRAGVHVGGGAPGTRETDLLAPTATVGEIHALLLTGGSAFGLDAASGVMRYLRERQIGFDMRVARIPIVPAAVIFDLGCGSAEALPDLEAGYAACQAARPDEDRQGNVGVGCGATVGKLRGPQGQMKGGLGLATNAPSSRIRVGVLAVVNAVGDVLAADGTIIAGTREGDRFVDSAALLRSWLHGNDPRSGTGSDTGAETGSGTGSDGRENTRGEDVGDNSDNSRDDTRSDGRGERSGESLGNSTDDRGIGLLGNTTLVAIATDALLDKLALTRLAQQAHDGLARAINPVHTGYDGDTVFALSTGEEVGEPNALAAVAVELVAQAIRQAVLAAASVEGAPAARDFHNSFS